MGRKPKAVSELGSVQKRGNGWRAEARFAFGPGQPGPLIGQPGPMLYGPAARTKAVADLARARQASTREEMHQRLRDMMVASGQPFSRRCPQRAVRELRQGEEADATHCSWAVQVLHYCELTAIAKYLGRRKAKSGVVRAPFTGWVVRHDCCALVIHMKEQVSYTGMLKNVRRWCGQTYMDSLLWWDVVEAQELGIVKEGDASQGRPLQQVGPPGPPRKRLCGKQRLRDMMVASG